MSTRTHTSTTIGPDLISNLPDPILHHILGFMKTKQAVKTCVLSKRWEHLWASVRSLHLDADDFTRWDLIDNKVEGEWENSSQRFVKFVNAVILRREPLDLDVFHLNCGEFNMNEHVGDWINYAVEFGTRVLHFWHCFSLPSCIYTCTTIEELYLYKCEVIPCSTVNLLNLKKLVMEEMEHAPFPNNLLSGCPMMEYLELNDYLFSECSIAHEHLKHLQICNCDLHPLLIDAPNLLSFSYVQCDIPEKTPPHQAALSMPSLMFASLETSAFRISDHLKDVTLMLESFSNVELLNLHFGYNQLKELCDLQLPELPVFHKLKHVSVTVDTFVACFQMVAWILRSSPNLSKLTLVEDIELVSLHEWEAIKNGYIDSSLTSALTSCKNLEIIDIKYKERSDFSGLFVDVFVDSAKELENVKIQSSQYVSFLQWI